ncbi:MAG: hypothetical protein HQL88_01640, partial [Magnetococcales bacterium]|nr:hypothetical protein [Magnetococcales bacterium]
DRQVSSEAFFQEAFRFFGEDADDYTDPRAKGRRLAELVGERRGLLVLDGLEPLQYPPGEAHRGALRDAGMAVFLQELARHNPGLCLVTTRVPVYELQNKAAARQVDLEHLTPQTGAELLASYHLTSTQQEREAASAEYGGHALALNLLGSALVRYCHGEIRQRDTIKALSGDQTLGRHAQKVMASYERWLEKTPELALLYLLCLFDRPATEGEIRAVLESSPIQGLTERLLSWASHAWKNAIHKLRALLGLFDRPATEGESRAVLGSSPIQGLTDRLPPWASCAWQNAVHELRELHLLSPTQNNALDCHPLVREYFGGQLKTRHPDAWQEAHRRLFDHFCAIPTQHQPNTLEALLPLYRALPHGCQAGLQQQALEGVYWRRIARGEEAYAIHKLGAYGLELGAMAAFFEQPWSHPAAGLTPIWQSFVLSEAAFRLRAMGRLPEVIQAYEAGLAMDRQHQTWQNAAISANNLSETHLLCADLPRAIAFAQLAVAVSDTTEDAFYQMSCRTTRAAALHQNGAVAEAGTLFLEAEARQQRQQPDYPILYSFRGYQYNDLLLSQKDYRQVLQRAEKTLQWATKRSMLLEIALDQLTLGQAHSGLKNWKEAGAWLEKAVSALERAGGQDDIPRGLIARAAFYRLQQQWEKARGDLEEAWEISRRGGMTFYILQLHLEESALALAQGTTAAAIQHLDQAESLIQEKGLFRFAEQADRLRRQLGGTPRAWDKLSIQRQIAAKTKEIFRQYGSGIPSR